METKKILDLIYIGCGVLGVILLVGSSKYEETPVSKFFNGLGAFLACIGGFGLLMN